MMLEIETTPTTLIPGRYYRVPVVRASYCGSRLQWWPVIGPPHEDAEFIKFPSEHYHVDWRFLSASQQNRAVEYANAYGSTSAKKDQVVFGFPITTDQIEGKKSQYRKCRSADFPEYRILASWHKTLENHYQSCTLGPAMICPHKGASLANIQPVDGVITCPLHGLRWSSDTGEMVRRTEP